MQRRALEQWMVARHRAGPPAGAGGAEGAPVDSALAEVAEATSSAASGSDVSDSSDAECARYTLEDFPCDASEEEEEDRKHCKLHDSG